MQVQHLLPVHRIIRGTKVFESGFHILNTGCRGLGVGYRDNGIGFKALRGPGVKEMKRDRLKV